MSFLIHISGELSFCKQKEQRLRTMAGVVLETLSWKKLIILGVSLLVLLITFFLIGGKIGNVSKRIKGLFYWTLTWIIGGWGTK